MRGRHCVGGGAPVNFGRRPQNRRWRHVAALAAKKCFIKDSRKNFLLSSKCSDDFLVIENCNKISTQQQLHRRRADKLSAAARRSTKVGGGGAHKLSAAAERARLYCRHNGHWSTKFAYYRVSILNLNTPQHTAQCTCAHQ